MKTAFFGSSLVSAYWNGAATYYRGIIRCLDALGYMTTFYEPDAYGRQAHRDINDPAWARVFVYENSVEGLSKALDDARDADIIIKASGVGVFDEKLERLVLDIRKPGARAVFWDVDAPATLDRVHEDPRDPFRPLIPRYDFVFTYGGGDPVVKAYRSLGARSCVPVYNALDPSTHFPVLPDKRFGCDLGFLGNRLPDRETRVRDFFFGAASRLPERKFILGGNGWDEPFLPNVHYLGHLYTVDHNAFNSTANAVLNVNRESMARYGFSPPTRVFEAAGAAACVITDAWEGIGLFLEPGREVLVARNGDEVAEIIKALKHGEAASIGRAAHERVMREHTYAQRARVVDAILKG